MGNTNKQVWWLMPITAVGKLRQKDCLSLGKPELQNMTLFNKRKDKKVEKVIKKV